jgi:hypothetical protein
MITKKVEVNKINSQYYNIKYKIIFINLWNIL